mmetsp:Transcript_75387/g.201460  ORF Transcript_75387/g.201460 Transcript_75387/m.201460 type:complete len:310 (-) Transcript_75387:576-1505(-)
MDRHTRDRFQKRFHPHFAVVRVGLEQQRVLLRGAQIPGNLPDALSIVLQVEVMDEAHAPQEMGLASNPHQRRFPGGVVDLAPNLVVVLVRRGLVRWSQAEIHRPPLPLVSSPPVAHRPHAGLRHRGGDGRKGAQQGGDRQARPLHDPVPELRHLLEHLKILFGRAESDGMELQVLESGHESMLYIADALLHPLPGPAIGQENHPHPVVERQIQHRSQSRDVVRLVARPGGLAQLREGGWRSCPAEHPGPLPVEAYQAEEIHRRVAVGLAQFHKLPAHGHDSVNTCDLLVPVGHVPPAHAPADVHHKHIV